MSPKRCTTLKSSSPLSGVSVLCSDIIRVDLKKDRGARYGFTLFMFVTASVPAVGASKRDWAAAAPATKAKQKVNIVRILLRYKLALLHPASRLTYWKVKTALHCIFSAICARVIKGLSMAWSARAMSHLAVAFTTWPSAIESVAGMV